MPDDLFDDNNLLPDWLQDDDDEGPGADALGPADDAVTPGGTEWAASAASSAAGASAPPPWETYPGRANAAGQRPAGAPPWQSYTGQTGPTGAPAAMQAPWQSHPGSPPPAPPGGMPPAAAPPPPTTPAPAARDSFSEIDWAADDSLETPASESSEIPRGLTGALPWMSTADQQAPSPGAYEAGFEELDFGMDESPAAAPPVDEAPAGSLLDRLKALSPEPDAAETPVEPVAPRSEEEADWMSAFGDAAEYTDDVPLPEADEDLAWLAGDAETPSPEPAAEAAAPPAPEAQDAELFPDWLMDGDEDVFAADELAPSEAQPVAASADEEFGWLDDDALATPEGEPEEPAAELAAEPIADEEDAFGWLDEAEFETPEEAAPPEAAVPLPSEEAFDDLFAFEEDEEPVEEVEPATPAGDALPAWLSGEAQPPTAASDEWATDQADDAGEDEAEVVPDWMSGGDEFADEFADDSDLSYDEWEQSEIEREMEAAKTDEDRLLEEVPDWFAKADAPGALPPAETEGPEETGPEFVPDWFSGLEAQDVEAAPDWFQNLDYTADPLAAPSAEPTPPSTEPAGEVPDWFKADSFDSSGADWAAAFGGPETPEPAAPPPPAEPALEESDDEWMHTFAPTDAPAVPPGTGRLESPEEVDDFVERFDPLAPLEPGASAPPEPTPSALSGADLGGEMDWLTGISADDIAEEPEPPALEPESAEPDFQDIDSLLGISDSESALTAPGEQATVPEDFDWSSDDALFDFEDEPAPSHTGLLGLGLDDAADSEAAQVDAEDLFGDVFPTEEAEATPKARDVTPAFAAEELSDEPEAEEPATPVEAMRPDWLAEMRPTDLPVTLAVGDVQLDMPQAGLDDLPESLRTLRQQLGRGVAEGVEETAETSTTPGSGPLAGIENALPVVAAALPAVTRERAVEGLVITPEEQSRVERLQGLLDLLAAEEEELEDDQDDEGFTFGAQSPFELGDDEDVDPAALAAAELDAQTRPRRKRTYRVDRLLIVLLMFAALIVPFITDAVHFAADPPALEGEHAAVAAAVDALEEGDFVLVAFEYGPTAAGELDPLAEAVLRDIFARRAIPLALSTSPAGAFHAEAVFAPLVDDPLLLKARGNGEPQLVAGEDYVLLAYLPGEAVGVRTLARATESTDEAVTHPSLDTDLRGDDTQLPITDLATEVALIVVVGEDSTAVRVWAEQLTSLPVPKVALVTAAVEALTGPYVNADGYRGYLAGVRDTYSYNAARNANTRTPYTVPEGVDFEVPNPEEARWHSMALGAALAAALVALGLVVNLFRALGRRRRR